MILLRRTEEDLEAKITLEEMGIDLLYEGGLRFSTEYLQISSCEQYKKLTLHHGLECILRKWEQ